MNDLELIPTEDLLKELDKRYSKGFVAAWWYTDHERDVYRDDHAVHFGYGTDESFQALSNYISYNLQRNYHERNVEAIELDD